MVYLDDILVHSNSFEGLCRNLKLVFDRLPNINLVLNPMKCHLIGKQVEYLGHVVSSCGILTSYSKIEAVKD